MKIFFTALFILFTSTIWSQVFRIERPVPDDIQTNGSYLYGEPSISNPGQAHNGIDILVRYDTVYSATDGVVTFVGYVPGDSLPFTGYEPNGAGNFIFTRSNILNANYYFLYAHLTRPFVTVNQSVTKGQPIALSGNTGYSTGPHLHFEIRKNTQTSGTRNKRNAELWCGIKGTGAIYGRVPNAADGTRVDISPDPKPRPPYTTYGYSLTYLFADTKIGSDDFYNENYAIGDVKPGTYTITALNGTYRRVVSVQAGKVVNADAITDLDEDTYLADHFELSQNYPNPFNPSTLIDFQIPERSYVQLKVYDLLGSQIAVIVDEERNGGLHREVFSAANLPSGFYVYSIVAISADGKTEFRASKKMILLK